MKVFISWSGQRSRYVAEQLRAWLPKVIQVAKPWMSDQDISIGTRWLSEVTHELADSKVGIVVLTPENQHAPWVMFEAGALSKSLDQTFVCPYLFDLTPSQLSGPITQFQACPADYDGTRRLAQALVRASHQTWSGEWDEILDTWWPRLKQKLEHAPPQPSVVQPRSQGEILQEILETTREQLRRENLRLEQSKKRDEKLDDFMKEVGANSLASQRRMSAFQKFFRSKLAPLFADQPDELASLFDSESSLAAIQASHRRLESMSEDERNFLEQLLRGEASEQTASSVAAEDGDVT